MYHQQCLHTPCHSQYISRIHWRPCNSVSSNRAFKFVTIAHIHINLLSVRIFYGRVIALYPHILHKRFCVNSGCSYSEFPYCLLVRSDSSCQRHRRLGRRCGILFLCDLVSVTLVTVGSGQAETSSESSVNWDCHAGGEERA